MSRTCTTATRRAGAADAAAALAGDGFDVRPLSGAARIPDDAGLVVLAGPTHELAPAEVDALDAYVRGGGRLLVLADTGTPKSVAGLLERFGVILERDVVVDEGARLFGADGLSARIAHWNPKLVPDAARVERAAAAGAVDPSRRASRRRCRVPGGDRGDDVGRHRRRAPPDRPAPSAPARTWPAPFPSARSPACPATGDARVVWW